MGNVLFNHTHHSNDLFFRLLFFLHDRLVGLSMSVHPTDVVAVRDAGFLALLNGFRGDVLDVPFLAIHVPPDIRVRGVIEETTETQC